MFNEIMAEELKELRKRTTVMEAKLQSPFPENVAKERHNIAVGAMMVELIKTCMAGEVTTVTSDNCEEWIKRTASCIESNGQKLEFAINDVDEDRFEKMTDLDATVFLSEENILTIKIRNKPGAVKDMLNQEFYEAVRSKYPFVGR